jgi:uncharacterized membrane protein
MVYSMVYFLSFLIGCVCGLRSMTAPAVIAWGARLGWLHLDGSPLAFLANQISLIVFSLFALGELVADKLPFIPRRTQAGPLIVRAIFGAGCGAALCFSSAAAGIVGALLGGLGGVVGAFAGYHYRAGLSGKVPDLLLALVEDAVAIGGGFLVVAAAKAPVHVALLGIY